MADKGLAGVLVLVAGGLNVDVKVHLCGSTTGGCFGVAYSYRRRIQGFLRFAKAKAKGEDPKKEGGFIGLYNKMLELASGGEKAVLLRLLKELDPDAFGRGRPREPVEGGTNKKQKRPRTSHSPSSRPEATGSRTVVAGAAPAPPDLAMVSTEFDVILRHLRIDVIKEKLVEQDICSVADLLILSVDQYSQLGMVMGQSNRVRNWKQQRDAYVAPARAAGGRPQPVANPPPCTRTHPKPVPNSPPGTITHPKPVPRQQNPSQGSTTRPKAAQPVPAEPVPTNPSQRCTGLIAHKVHVLKFIY